MERKSLKAAATAPTEVAEFLGAARIVICSEAGEVVTEYLLQGAPTLPKTTGPVLIPMPIEITLRSTTPSGVWLEESGRR